MLSTIFLGALILGLVWAADQIKLYVYWMAVSLILLISLFVLVVFVLPWLYYFLLNL